MIGRSSTSRLLLVLLWWASVTLLQPLPSVAQVGVSDCACGPSTYRFALDLSNTCDDIFGLGPAASLSQCTVEPSTVTDQVPVTLLQINITELASDLQTPLRQTSKTGQFVDGEKFEYTSIIANTTAVSTANIPRALYILFLGSNQNQDLLALGVVISLSSDCSKYPAFQINANIGWAYLESLDPPPRAYCPNFITLSPMAASPTAVPSRKSPFQPSPTTTAPPTKIATPTNASLRPVPLTPSNLTPTSLSPVNNTAPIRSLPVTPDPRPPSFTTQAPLSSPSSPLPSPAPARVPTFSLPPSFSFPINFSPSRTTRPASLIPTFVMSISPFPTIENTLPFEPPILNPSVDCFQQRMSYRAPMMGMQKKDDKKDMMMGMGKRKNGMMKGPKKDDKVKRTDKNKKGPLSKEAMSARGGILATDSGLFQPVSDDQLTTIDPDYASTLSP